MKKIIYIFVLMVAFTSCDKNEVEVQKTQKWIELKDNDELVSVLNQLDNDKINGVTSSKILNGLRFYSLWDVYQDIINSDEEQKKILIKKYPNVVVLEEINGEMELKLNLKDKTLAKVLTPSGLIKIGSKIIKVEGDIIKTIVNGDENLISNLETTTTNESNEYIKVDRIICCRNSNKLENGLQKAPLMLWEDYEYSYSKVRCHWEKWIDYNPVFNYASVGGKITNQEKKWLGWLTRAQAMSLHMRSDYLNCTDYSYGGLLGDGPLDLYAVSYQNYGSIEASKRFSGSGNVTSGHVQIDFQIYGNTYYK